MVGSAPRLNWKPAGLRKHRDTGLLPEPVRRRPIPRAVRKAAPPIDHRGIVLRGQAIRNGSSILLLNNW